jgi:YD repeat-containing protein
MLVDTLASTTTYVKGTTYDGAGRVTRGELGEDEGDPVLVTTYEYFEWETANGAGRLKRILSGTPEDPDSLQDLRYENGGAAAYDAVGNLLNIYDYKSGSPQVQGFAYDELNRLTSAYAAGGDNGYGDYASAQTPESYTYDANTGNLASKAGVSYTYEDSAHKHAVTDLGGNQKYWYDDNGNMTTRVAGGITYTLSYDAENQLIGVSASGLSASFTYDGDPAKVRRDKFHRVQATIGGVTTTYIGEPLTNTSRASHTEWQGEAFTRYYYAGSTRVAMRTGTGQVKWLLSDHPPLLFRASHFISLSTQRTRLRSLKNWVQSAFSGCSSPKCGDRSSHQVSDPKQSELGQRELRTSFHSVFPTIRGHVRTGAWKHYKRQSPMLKLPHGKSACGCVAGRAGAG